MVRHVRAMLGTHLREQDSDIAASRNRELRPRKPMRREARRDLLGLHDEGIGRVLEGEEDARVVVGPPGLRPIDDRARSLRTTLREQREEPRHIDQDRVEARERTADPAPCRIIGLRQVEGLSVEPERPLAWLRQRQFVEAV